MKYKNITNVKAIINEIDAFQCTLEIDFDNNGIYEKAEYTARPGAGGICDSVINDIKNNNFSGPILNFNPIIEDNTISLARTIREQRNYLLSKTDWTQLPDVPPGTKAKWSVYRQKLRDITNQIGFPKNIIWPEEPK